MARIVAEVKTLDEAERHQLQSILHQFNGYAASAPENGLAQQLAAEGLLSLPTPDTVPPQLAAPILLHGRPLSEILVEERR